MRTLKLLRANLRASMLLLSGSAALVTSICLLASDGSGTRLYGLAVAGVATTTFGAVGLFKGRRRLP